MRNITGVQLGDSISVIAFAGFTSKEIYARGSTL